MCRDLLEHESETAESARVLRLALVELEAGRSVILHTALGPSDARLLGTNQGSTAAFQERLGICLGRLLREAILRSSVRRAVICGGDTSARAGSQLGIFAVTTLKPLSPGSPLCLPGQTNRGLMVSRLSSKVARSVARISSAP